MIVFESLEDIKAAVPTAVALGFFDSLHPGHMEVISKALNSSFTPAVFTFRGGKGGSKTLLTEDKKREMLSKMGVEVYISPLFSEFCYMSGEEFFKNILLEKLNAKLLVCGEDFRFGKNRDSGAKELLLLAKKAGIEALVLPLKQEGGEKISTTRIRALLEKGNIKEAELLLGRKIK